jgi:sensor c-di-GMP phosphodiesterase-like protein
MAHQMDLDIVAEGIESMLIYEFLLRSGCHYAQV